MSVLFHVSSMHLICDLILHIRQILPAYACRKWMCRGACKVPDLRNASQVSCHLWECRESLTPSVIGKSGSMHQS